MSIVDDVMGIRMCQTWGEGVGKGGRGGRRGSWWYSEGVKGRGLPGLVWQKHRQHSGQHLEFPAASVAENIIGKNKINTSFRSGHRSLLVWCLYRPGMEYRNSLSWSIYVSVTCLCLYVCMMLCLQRCCICIMGHPAMLNGVPESAGTHLQRHCCQYHLHH